MGIMFADAVTPTAVSVNWADTAQGVVNDVVSAFNAVVPIALTLLGVGIGLKMTVRLIKRYARV